MRLYNVVVARRIWCKPVGRHIRVTATEETRQLRRGGSDRDTASKDVATCPEELMTSDEYGSLIFDNDGNKEDAVEAFLERHLLPLVHEDLHRLSNMVRQVPNFPSQDIDFRHVLGIPQHPGGLELCSSLLQAHFTGGWAEVGGVVCCEAGGFVFASSLFSRVDVPLVLIRKSGKLPPPTISVAEPSSYISGSANNATVEGQIEIEKDVVPKDGSVVVVDDVLSSGKTLCAVLGLLIKVGVAKERISVMVVAEFPVHRGRWMLREHGYGCIRM
ncbi:phosphoribosyltransferase-like protein [Rhexocercosporidium sp. MPI-PUGE-AT-0058]|nr:phosphoribosyltransferase-like protein [Rhexocercosporidium sp. MPI-PUGE-AT-0058]